MNDRIILWFPAIIACLLGACSEGAWNNPYPNGEKASSVIYSSFSERPKHLDPVRSYSSNEYQFIAQIYEPPLQYHYLARPYKLIPLTATQLPRVRYLDAAGRPVSRQQHEAIAFSEYIVSIQPGIRYQPHPALARDAQDNARYLHLSAEDLKGIHVLGDFSMTGSRELTAADYVYQIKRIASPYLHSPIAGVMREYIVGFDAFRKQVGERYGNSPKGVWQDLRDIDFAGLSVDDRYTYRIRIHGEYPQLVYWLAMPFFAPMPWEAEKFYSQAGMEERNITLNWYPVGTGPFMLTENNPNLRMVMEKNPNFHGEQYPVYGEPQDLENGLLDDAGKALPLVHKAVYSLEKENIPYWNKFLQGYYDASGVSSDSFDQAIQFGSQGDVLLTEMMQAKDIQLETSVRTSILYMGFNMQDPVVGGFSERARLLRRAISIAVDYEEYISIFANGRGIPAQGPVPPGIFGNIEGEAGINPYVYDWVDGEPRRKDLEKARQLMAEAGYEDGIDQASSKPLVLYFDTPGAGPGAKAHFSWMRKQYQKLGIQLVIRANRLQPLSGENAQGHRPDLPVGLECRLPGSRKFLFPAVWTECQGKTRWREHCELPEPGV